ncbi:protease inhibitor carrapatin-like [Dermacentor silvarum]|uniref:protease inhibitor carrapatin-like n=1 Tax=Dermacentor silvarum TaxID=543639 RepID=UPI002101C36E|nr:protease inhibitor carrapatin-like [Dermacentor silvarum]
MKTFVLLALFGAALAADDFDRQCAPSADPGPCKGYFPKWWYNVLSGQCELFVYGGCQGNDNKYDTQKECEETCASAASGKLPSMQRSFQHFFLDEYLLRNHSDLRIADQTIKLKQPCLI